MQQKQTHKYANTHATETLKLKHTNAQIHTDGATYTYDDCT